jgi:acylphosphatase
LDGTVYIEARGTDREVSDFIQAVKKGPSPYAKVTRVDLVELSDDKVYRDFAVTN